MSTIHDTTTATALIWRSSVTLGGRERLGEALGRRAQRVLLGQGLDPLGVRRRMRDRAIAPGHRRVARHPYDPARRGDVVRIGAKLRADRVRDVGRGQDRIQRAVLRHERARGLLTDPMHPGESVGGITAEHGVVVIAVAWDPVLRADPRLVHVRQLAHPAKGVQDAHLRVFHECEEVTVARDDLGRPGHPLDERRDNILGFVALRCRGRDPERVEELDDDLHLRIDRVGWIVRSGDAVRLVRRHRVDAELWPPVGIERDEQSRRLSVGHESREEVEEAERRVHERTVRCAPLGDRVIGAIGETRRVYEERSLRYRRTTGAANTASSAAMNRSFSGGVPSDARKHPWQPGHIEISRMSTLSPTNRACTSAGFPSCSRKRMKFVTEGKTSMAETRRSAEYTRSRSVAASASRRWIDASSRAMRVATASVNVLTLYGSAAAVK